MTDIRHWRTIRRGVVIVETPIFTRQVLDRLSDDEYRRLQVILANRPTVGSLIKGSGGLRKIRWAIEGRGKRGGVRVIYYWAAAHQRLLMLMIYSKRERDDLRPGQLKALRKTVVEEF
ncbi:MAG: hypothetical protein ACRDH2_21350 [Anaerolineales bacterium]